MNEEYKFGVCYCNLDIIDRIEDLVIFDTYNEACDYYIKKILGSKDLSWIDESFKDLQWINHDLWIVWIRKSDNKIEQFDQLIWKTRCKVIDIGESND